MKTPTIITIHVSIYFLILFTAFGAFQNIITKIHQQQGDSSLGPFQLTFNYTAFMIANIFVPKYSHKYSLKWLITLPALAYAFHYILGFFLSTASQFQKYLITAIGAALNGIGASFLWTNVGTYIHNICAKYGQSDNEGYYYGLFSVFYSSSNILGALIVLFGLQLLSLNSYFILVASIALISFFYGVLFIKDVEYQNQGENIGPQITIKQQFFKTVNYCKIMYAIIPCILIDGIIIGVTSSTMLHLLPSSDKKQNELNSGLCLLCYGIGGTIGGFIGGKLCDKILVKKVLMFSLVLYVFLCAASSVIYLNPNAILAMVCCFIWGFNLYFLEAVLMVACSRIYGGAPETFAIVKQFHSLSFVIYEIVNIPTHNELPVHYIMGVIVLFFLAAVFGVTKIANEKELTYNNLKEKKQYSILSERRK